MNYFLVSYQAAVHILILVISFIMFGGASLFFGGRLIVFFKLSYVMSICLLIILFSSSIISSYFVLTRLEDKLNHGVIKELFILDSGDKPLLTLWLMRVHKMKKGSFYDQRLETFELENGKNIGMVEMQHRKESSDYKLYWVAGSKTVYGVDENKEARIFSLTQPGFLKKIGTVSRFKENAREGWDKRTPNFTQRGWFEKGWTFLSVKESLAKNLIGPDGKLNVKSAAFLKPVFIEELNKESAKKNKIWVFHRSAAHKNIESLISYVDVNGNELSSINLNEVFNRTKVRPCAVFTRQNEVMIFVTCGNNKRILLSSDLGFTLAALRIDKSTGKVIDRIDYIK